MRPFKAEAMNQISRLNQYIQEYGSQASSSFLDSVSSFFLVAERTLLGLIMLPFMLFYLLRDDSKILPAILPKLPVFWRKESESSIREINQKLSRYIRGQLIIGLLVAVLLTIGFLILGLSYGTTLAILAGFMNFLIPSFGALVIAVPAVLIGLLHSPWTALWVAVIFYVVQHIQSHVVAPLVLSNQMEIHPLTILILLIWGGKVFGFTGLILVIPLYASIRVIVQHTFVWYKRTSGYYEDI
jgi:predicted PurR-regulated permease PerM